MQIKATYSAIHLSMSKVPFVYVWFDLKIKFQSSVQVHFESTAALELNLGLIQVWQRKGLVRIRCSNIRIRFECGSIGIFDSSDSGAAASKFVRFGD